MQFIILFLILSSELSLKMKSLKRYKELLISMKIVTFNWFRSSLSCFHGNWNKSD